MPEQFAFRERIPELVGGREGVVATTRHMLCSTHKLTKAGDSSKIPEQKVRGHVVSTLLSAVLVRLRDPLTQLLEEHLDTVGEEYELLNGERPCNIPDPLNLDTLAEIAIWEKGLGDEIVKSLTGDVDLVLGREAVANLVYGQKPISDLVNALLAVPVSDEDRALHIVGVTQLDVEALIDVARGMTEPAADTTDDPFSDTGWVSEDDEAEDALEIEGPLPTPPEVVAAVSAALNAAAQRPKRAESVEPDDYSRAAQIVIEALADHLTEGELGEKLSVSRPHINNYRRGKTAWHPTESQADVLVALLKERIETLTAALAALEENLL